MAQLEQSATSANAHPGHSRIAAAVKPVLNFVMNRFLSGGAESLRFRPLRTLQL